MNKYRAKKVKTEDGTFDSKREYARWCELKLLERAGEIEDLRRQVSYTLVGSQKGTTRNERPINYRADFVYYKDGELVVEDSKGMRTPEYVIKRKLMKYFHDIEIQEV